MNQQYYYFIGIGGIGMSGIAKVLKEQGHRVAGSDMAENNETKLLKKLGIAVNIGHSAKNITESIDVVIVSGAIPKDNPEIMAAKQMDLVILKRSEMLDKLINQKKSIAVTGTHGKTTTTGMLTKVLIDAGMDPMFVIGAELESENTNARNGEGDYAISEVCEYKKAFLNIHPYAAVITNIDADHLDCYKDIDDIKDTFAKFVEQIDKNGLLVYCADDANTREVCSLYKGKRISYGIAKICDFRATNIQELIDKTTFTVANVGNFCLIVPGLHNVLNALAVIAVATNLGIKVSDICGALEKFGGAERRFQLKGTYNGASVIDDYAHHPTEIEVTLEAARSRYPGKRIIAVFQPHQHSRTRLLKDDFIRILRKADIVLMPEIYAVRDTSEDIASISSAVIVDALNQASPGKAVFTTDYDRTIDYLKNHIDGKDVVLTIGAGPVNIVGENLLNS